MMTRTLGSFAVFPMALAMFHAGVLAAPANGEAQDDPHDRVARLEEMVLAPCCYREPVSKHQSEIALKMRLEIARWVEEGRSDREILGTYVSLYGAKVLVDPRTRPGWWTPWIPWLAVMASMGLGLQLLGKWRARPVRGLAPASGLERAALPDFEEDE